MRVSLEEVVVVFPEEDIFDKVSGKCSALVHRNIVSPYRGGSHKGAQRLRSPSYNVGA